MNFLNLLPETFRDAFLNHEWEESYFRDGLKCWKCGLCGAKVWTEPDASYRIRAQSTTLIECFCPDCLNKKEWDPERVKRQYDCKRIAMARVLG